MATLKAELADDPLGRGYAAMSDAAAAADLNTAYRSRNKTSLSGDGLFAATVAAEFAGLTEAKQNLWMMFCGRDVIDPFGAANVAFVQWVFGAGSATVAALALLRVEPITRAQELGLGNVREGEVQQARAN